MSILWVQMPCTSNFLIPCPTLSLYIEWQFWQRPPEAPLAVAWQSLRSLRVDAAESQLPPLHLHTPSLESFEVLCYDDSFHHSGTPSIEEIIEIICRDSVVKLRRLYIMDAMFAWAPHPDDAAQVGSS